MNSITVSVIIPINKVTPQLPQLFHSLENQGTSYNYEVIIVLDCLESVPYNGGRFRIIKSKGINNSYIARNTGIEVAKGYWILFTDSDCVPELNWIQSMMKYSDNFACVVGKTIEHTKSDMLNTFATENTFGLGTDGIKFYIINMPVFPTCNVAYQKGILGKFEEVETCADALKSKEIMDLIPLLVTIAPNAIINHYIGDSIWDIFKKRIRTGKSVVNKLSLWLFPLYILYQFLGFIRNICYKQPIWKSLCYAYYEIVIHLGVSIGAYFGKRIKVDKKFNWHKKVRERKYDDEF